jgi:hypothetical protein
MKLASSNKKQRSNYISYAFQQAHHGSMSFNIFATNKILSDISNELKMKYKGKNTR